MHNLKNKLIAELKTYDEAAKEPSMKVSNTFLAEVALLVESIYKLCKLDRMKHDGGAHPYGEHKDMHHHDHMKYDETAKPNMFE